MSEPATTPSRFVGCDVAKREIVVFDSGSGQTRTIPNRKPDLIRFLRSLDANCLVVCEATGGYEARLLQACLACEVPVHRADARKVKAFIRSFGILGKTDAIDARALTQYGIERHQSLARWQQPDPVREELQTLVQLRIDFVQTRQAQSNRLAAPQAGATAAATKSLRAVLRTLDAQIRAIEARLRELIKQHPVLARDEAVLRGIKSFGPIVAATLLGLMPELGRICGKRAASLAGLAPHPRQSGNSVGYRATKGGRPAIKRALFMAAQVAARHHPELHKTYQRLIANGKKKLVAITAVMRKLIVIANAKLRDAIIQNELPQVS